jgi:hypothetical protein
MPPPRTTLTRAAVLGTLAALVTLTAGTASAASAPAGTASDVSRTAGRPTASRIVYAARTQTLPGNGTSRANVTCPGGALPVGGGTLVQDPRTEQVLQAGFSASTPGHMAGYQADVRVHGLRRGSKVKVAVQVACVPAPATVIYAVRSQTLSGNGTRLPAATCPAGELPVGGGTAIQDPRTEQVLQAGFRSHAPGSVVGYQASVRVHGLRHGSKVKAAVQVACAPAPHPPVYGPLA